MFLSLALALVSAGVFHLGFRVLKRNPDGLVSWTVAFIACVVGGLMALVGLYFVESVIMEGYRLDAAFY